MSALEKVRRLRLQALGQQGHSTLSQLSQKPENGDSLNVSSALEECATVPDAVPTGQGASEPGTLTVPNQLNWDRSWDREDIDLYIYYSSVPAGTSCLRAREEAVPAVASAGTSERPAIAARQAAVARAKEALREKGVTKFRADGWDDKAVAAGSQRELYGRGQGANVIGSDRVLYVTDELIMACTRAGMAQPIYRGVDYGVGP
jgi:hypothetical protein